VTLVSPLPRTVINAAVLVALAGSLATSGTASAATTPHIDVATAGDVRAQLSFARVDEVSVRDVRLTIVRAGVTLLDAALSTPPAGVSFDVPAPNERPPVHVRDLDGDGEPEVWVDLYSGGAHCCLSTRLFRYQAAPQPAFAEVVGPGDAKVLMDWGNGGYRPADLERDRRLEWLSHDDRFAYAFTSYAESVEPLQIWRLGPAGLVDVTREYGARVRRDLTSLRRLYLRSRRTRDVRGVLAAYVAEAYLVGRSDDGWRLVRSAQRRRELGGSFGPTGARYVRALRKFLVSTGYARR